MFRSVLTVFILSLMLLPYQGKAQILSERDMKGINHSIVPILGYSSDYGLFGGGLYQRIDYADGIRPFLTNTLADLTASTNGKWTGRFEYERTELFGRPVRTRSIIEAVRNPISNYFGIGNNSSFSNSEFEDGIFYLLKKNAGARFEIRTPVFYPENGTPIEGVLRLRASYTDTDDRGADTHFVQDPPPGVSGGWVNSVGVGFVHDIRNNEFDPRRGIRSEIGADFTPPVAGNDYNFSTYFVDISGFISITENIVLAQRMAGEYSYGDVPYFELPALGNQYGLRGYALNRFLGKSSILYMAEVRSWLFTILEGEVKFGGHIFYDTGRVFSSKDSPRFFDNWKRTWGFGGAMSAFNPDLIFRGEIGFSDETLRIYAGIGFAF